MRSAQVLMSISLPGHVVFFLIIYFVKSSQILPFTVWLMLFYLMTGFVQVLALFLFCYWLVLFVWRLACGVWNPDNDTIPLLTALGDLIGISLLFVCFILLEALDSHDYPSSSSLINKQNQTHTYF